MRHDVIVVGGGYAGMAAALQLLRARRSVLVIDAGARRNRFAATAHGFLGRDGADPAAIAAEARNQLEAYPTLDWLEARAVAAAGARDAFAVTTERGGRHEARRLILALGVADALPKVEGLAERWGRSVFQCPYCHAYELDGGRVGVLAAAESSPHQARLLADWGPVTFFAAGPSEPGPDDLAELRGAGVAVEETPIARIEGVADLRLADGRLLAMAALFTSTDNAPASPIAEALGCALEDCSSGVQIRVDANNETSVPGVFACGDTARAPHSLSLAVGDGASAGSCVHQSLVFG